jgi:mediator of RNA polymerase II transcription subunit 31
LFINFIDLAINNYFEDKDFVNYLNYLKYWKEPKYSKFIVYVHCLYFLDQLQIEKFRNLCKKKEFIDFISQQQGLHWKYYRYNREKN